MKKIQPRDITQLYNYKKRLNSFKSSLLYVVDYWFVVCHQSIFGSIDPLMSQNIKLTINRDVHMIANQMAAFFSMPSQSLYFLLSHHDVSIINHAYKHKHNATVAKIHNTRFMAVLMVFIRESSLFCSVHGTKTQSTNLIAQNHSSWAKVDPGSIDVDITTPSPANSSLFKCLIISILFLSCI